MNFLTGIPAAAIGKWPVYCMIFVISVDAEIYTALCGARR